ncbi:copper homeostasis protein CutC [Isobaculum melis]|uniref:PF03932 family protein CutC n=1 Tax=Isobaculum melis TaxID=142588 RepID=A0A1H9T8I5_9LACT|nr:copper homeostasis protein CutC [Isobaculum melis]SER93254.1 copper homeostasis protein [Isobaculum melis]
MIKEVCLENFTHVKSAIEKGAHRIELCDNLAVGGTTVSYGVMKQTIRYAQNKNIPVMAITRPRGGDFVYQKDEIEMMLADIQMAKQLGVSGIVLGCLQADGWLDEAANQQLLAAAENLEITFHMAFDAIPENKQLAAIDWLAQQGVHRILTHGGPTGSAIEENFERLKKTIQYAGNRLIILPGGGITNENAPAIAEALQVKELHGTKILGTLDSIA